MSGNSTQSSPHPGGVDRPSGNTATGPFPTLNQGGNTSVPPLPSGGTTIASTPAQYLPREVRILPHVYYEIDQTCHIPEHNENDWRIRESVYLAMLMHARLLLAFFEKPRMKKPRPDDVHCSHFHFPAKKVSVSPKNRKRLDKDIAHLTYHRLEHSPKTRPWPISKVIDPVKERAVDFVSFIINKPPNGTSQEEINRWKELQAKLAKKP